MPTYQIDFIGGGHQPREPRTIHCFDDAQALHWAAGFSGNHLAAEVLEGERLVGRVQASGDQA